MTAAMAITGACVAPQNGQTARLEGINWKVVEMDGFPVATASERPFVLSFGHDGQVRGQACNILGGQYHVDQQQQLIVGPIAMTEMACGEQIDRLEGRFLQIMSVPNQIQFKPDGGLLLGDPSQPALQLRPSGERQAFEGTGAGDLCNAGKYRYLVGQHRSIIPQPPAGATWRVTCSSCPVTADFSERRLNIVYDDKTGTVKSVDCG
ncbi:MAG: META domain-containing protein [Sphingomicrobium sp.]